MFIFPLKHMSVTTRFIRYTAKGYSDMHYGMDFGCGTGTQVLAANGGTVVWSGYDTAGGNMVIILDAAAGELSRYAHLSRRDVQKGDLVGRGQQIGLTGNTGTATTGPHLHFETWLVPKGYTYSFKDQDRYAVDPMSVCHLQPGQTFDNQGLTTCDPIPYPEPSVNLRQIVGRVDVQDAAVRLRLIPEVTKYQYIVGGEDRANGTLGSLVDGTSFAASAVCSNDGYDWALISTARGQFWVALLEGKTTLTTDGPVEPTDDKDARIGELEAEVAARDEEIYALQAKIKAAQDILAS